MSRRIIAGLLAVSWGIAGLAGSTARSDDMSPPAPTVDAIRTLISEAGFDRAEALAGQFLAEQPADSAGYARGLDLLIEARIGGGKVREDETEQLIRQAIELKHGLYGADHSEYGASLGLLGLMYSYRGDHATGRKYLEQALQIQESSLGPDDPALISTLSRLGNARMAEGDLVGAEREMRRQGELIAAHDGPMSMAAARTAYNTARLMIELGDYAEAEKLYDRTRQIVESVEGPNSARMAWAMIGLGTVREHLGQYTLSLENHRAALAVVEATQPPGHPMAASCWTNIAFTLMQMNDLTQAHDSILKAVDLTTKAYGVDSEFTGRAHVVAARIAGQREEFATAADHLDQAERIFGAVDRPYLEIEVRARRAELLRDEGRLSEAIREMALAADGVAELLPGHPDAVNWGVEHGDLLVRAGRLEEATRVYRAAIASAEAEVEEDYPAYGAAVAGLATSLSRSGDISEGFEQALRAEQLELKRLRFMVSALPERQAMRFAEGRVSTVGLIVSLAARPGQRESVAAAWNAVIQGRAAILDELALRRRALDVGGSGSAALAELMRASERLANLLVHGPSGGRVDSFAATVKAARARLEEAERALAQESRAVRHLLDQRQLDFRRVRQVLPAGSALVGYYLYDHDQTAFDVKTEEGRARTRSIPGGRRYVAFVLDADGETALVPLADSRTIDRLVEAWRAEIVSGVADDGPDSERRYRQVATSLRNQIWDPVASLLGDTRRIFVVPDGSLNLVNFSTLPEDQAYLIDSTEIQYLSAERDLVQDEFPAGRGLLVMGGPDYDADRSGSSQPRNEPPTALRGPNRSECPAFSDHKFGALEVALLEAGRVAEQWKTTAGSSFGENVALLTGARATESAFKLRAPGQRVVHLATHGFFIDQRRCAVAGGNERGVGGLVPSVERRKPTPSTRLALSGLALAGANHRATAGSDQDDGILTSEEIAALDLSGVEWAVLSACETGLGSVHAGEGVFGMRRSFRIAGVRTLILTLWPVRDDVAAHWMDALYTARLDHGRDTPSSVAAATRAVIDSLISQGLSAHPAIWGPFAASGGWH